MSPRTIHFWVLDKSPVSGPGRSPPSCNKWRLWRDSSLLRLTSWPLGVLRGQLACQWTRPSGQNWDPFVPGLLLMWTTGQSALTSKEQEALLISLLFPLSFLSLTLPILPRFFSPLVLDAGIWSKSLSLSWGLETDHLLFWSGLISGRAKFQSSLLWRPRVKSHNAWVSVGGRRCLLGHSFCSPSPASSPFFFQPGFLSSFWNLWSC